MVLTVAVSWKELMPNTVLCIFVNSEHCWLYHYNIPEPWTHIVGLCALPACKLQPILVKYEYRLLMWSMFETHHTLQSNHVESKKISEWEQKIFIQIQ